MEEGRRRPTTVKAVVGVGQVRSGQVKSFVSDWCV